MYIFFIFWQVKLNMSHTQHYQKISFFDLLLGYRLLC